jgi:hypothetical protein
VDKPYGRSFCRSDPLCTVKGAGPHVKSYSLAGHRLFPKIPEQCFQGEVIGIQCPEDACRKNRNQRQRPVALFYTEAKDGRPQGYAPKNDLNYFVRTITPQGEQRIYWGKDLPRVLEEAEAKVGESITATRVASKPVTVQEIQKQPDGSRQTVRVDAKRGQWQVDNHGVNRHALIKAYDVLVKNPEDRKKLERTGPLLVAARDQAVVELKREKLAAELNQRNLKNHTVRRR